MKTVWIVIGVIVLVLVVGAGGFYAGMTYQNNQASQARQRFMRARGIQEGQLSGGQLPGEGAAGDRQFFGGGAGFPGGGTMGEIKSIDGNTMTISTAENVTTVHLADDTPVQKTVTTGIGDLQAGMRVMVGGEQDKNGEVTASQVTIFDENFPGAGQPAPAP